MSCRWYIDADIVEAAELVVGELVANAQRHGAAPIEVSVRLHEDGDVLVSVRDAGRGIPRLRPIDEEAESGRGLHLVAAVSRWWRVDWQPGGGKAVTALLAADRGSGESG
jgi:two-component sensor histidine kinase